MVPRAEFSSYYGRRIVKPAPWDWKISTYLYAGGLSAGSALVAAGAELTGRAGLQRRSRAVSLAALGVGSAALVGDLGRPDRFLNMMRTVKLTSPMSVGSWILAGFAGFSSLAAAAEAADFVLGLRASHEPTRRSTGAGSGVVNPPAAAWLRASRAEPPGSARTGPGARDTARSATPWTRPGGRDTPRPATPWTWRGGRDTVRLATPSTRPGARDTVQPATLWTRPGARDTAPPPTPWTWRAARNTDRTWYAAAASLIPVARRVGGVGAGAFAAPLATYTAVLLSDTATPTWHGIYRELPFVFAGSALAAGAGASAAVAPGGQGAPARRLAVIGAALEVTAYTVLSRNAGFVGEPLHHGRPGRMLTAGKVCTGVGIVATGLLGRWRAGALLGGLALNAGSALVRFGVVEAGLESARDPAYVVVPQRERLNQRAASR